MSSNILTIETIKAKKSRLDETDYSDLGFGKYISDHMLIAEYEHGQWSNVRIEPYANLSLSPATAALHYGQAIFEGMKAYKNTKQDIFLFRPEENWKRFNLSAQRMCMPVIPEEIFLTGLYELVKLDAAWIPEAAGSALYIRPFMFSTDSLLGVRPSEKYTFIAFTSPVGTYFSKPPRVKIETHYIRAAEGGVGEAKCAGNYAASLYPAKLAHDEGYDQIIWTDAKDHLFIEESGAMNVMFCIDGKLITPAVSDTTLNGITRKSVLDIAKHWGITVEERRVTVKEIIDALKAGKLEAAFGVGTAAVISHFSAIGFEDIDYEIPLPQEESFSVKVKDFLVKLYAGNTEDVFGWTVKL